MKQEYTIGIVLTQALGSVLMIKKLRPAWQANRFNFPGGKVESDEDLFVCASREFEEETSLKIPYSDWCYIGKIESNDYEVSVCGVIYKPEYGDAKTMTNKEVVWCNIDNLPPNKIGNVKWLAEFVRNYFNQSISNNDKLHFGYFKYIKA